MWSNITRIFSNPKLVFAFLASFFFQNREPTSFSFYYDEHYGKQVPTKRDMPDIVLTINIFTWNMLFSLQLKEDISSFTLQCFCVLIPSTGKFPSEQNLEHPEKRETEYSWYLKINIWYKMCSCIYHGKYLYFSLLWSKFNSIQK